MSLYLVSEYAEVDYLEAFAYLDARSQSAALRWEGLLLSAFVHLGKFPTTGALRPDLAPAPLRVWPLDQYVIIYHPETEPITIVALIHASRDIPALLLQRAGNHAKEV